MYHYASSLLGYYVEISSYLCLSNLYGKIVEVTPYEVVILRDHIDKHSNDNYTLFIPINSIKYIKKI